MADEMIQGLKYFMMASGAQKGIIGIEDNKPDAIALVKEKSLPNRISKSASVQKSIRKFRKTPDLRGHRSYGS